MACQCGAITPLRQQHPARRQGAQAEPGNSGSHGSGPHSRHCLVNLCNQLAGVAGAERACRSNPIANNEAAAWITAAFFCPSGCNRRNSRPAQGFTFRQEYCYSSQYRNFQFSLDFRENYWLELPSFRGQHQERARAAGRHLPHWTGNP